MRRPTEAQIERARRVFELEAHEASSADERASAAGGVHDKLFARLAPLLGTAGARALFARSLKVTAVDFPFLANVVFEAKSTDSEALVRALRAQTPVTIQDVAVAWCAAMLSLLETLIGERLTANVVRSAWPALDVTDQETR